ncbi:MAG: hypothetical protein HUK06_08890 [Bacteroidaceae bacterium]|nr:hypothetical protein [Bacteroidaceae bacterium]
MADAQAPKSKRDLYMERLKTKYPDREFADDEALYEQANADYEDYDNQINGYKDKESKLTSLFSKDPRNAKFITDMAKGNDPWLAVINRLGIDGITDLLNDPSKQKAYAEENQKYVERLAKEKSLEEEYQKNLSESLAMLDKIQTEQGLSDETIDAAYDLVIRIANEAVLGKFSEETMAMALKAVSHDADVQTAASEAEVRGKNAKVEERLRKQKGGDGTSPLAGTNNMPAQSRQNKSIFNLADEA